MQIKGSGDGETTREAVTAGSKQEVKGTEGFQLRILAKKGDKGGLRSLCQETAAAEWVNTTCNGRRTTGTSPGVKEAARSSSRAPGRMLLHRDLLPQPQPWTAATEGI